MHCINSINMCIIHYNPSLSSIFVLKFVNIFSHFRYIVSIIFIFHNQYCKFWIKKKIMNYEFLKQSSLDKRNCLPKLLRSLLESCSITDFGFPLPILPFFQICRQLMHILCHINHHLHAKKNDCLIATTLSMKSSII